jgi:hypothetical protein
MKNPESTRYNLGRLERWLRYSNPIKVGDELDEIMTDLVAYSGWNDDYYKFLENRFYIIRQLRDMFWELENKRSEEYDGDHRD